MDSFYCIYLYIDKNRQQSINELLIQHGFAIEFDDSQFSEVKEFLQKKIIYIFFYFNFSFNQFHQICMSKEFEISFLIFFDLFRQSNLNNNNYIDERLLSRQGQNHIEYNIEENNFKHFIISIEHAYYFVKHPFTKRPCLPCFEVARLLNKDETYVSQLV
jgi:hypothetical protein